MNTDHLPASERIALAIAESRRLLEQSQRSAGRSGLTNSESARHDEEPPNRRGSVAHTFSMLAPDVLWLKYEGTVTYAERQVALPGAARMLTDGALHKLLVDFSAAEPVEEEEGARRDFIAAAIAAPWPDRVRIACVALSPRFAKPVELASVVRELDMRAFEVPENALSWLRDN